MILKIKKEDFRSGKVGIGKEVQKRLNGQTPGTIVCETRIVGDEVEINVKL